MLYFNFFRLHQVQNLAALLYERAIKQDSMIGSETFVATLEVYNLIMFSSVSYCPPSSWINFIIFSFFAWFKLDCSLLSSSCICWWIFLKTNHTWFTRPDFEEAVCLTHHFKLPLYHYKMFKNSLINRSVFTNFY